MAIIHPALCRAESQGRLNAPPRTGQRKVNGEGFRKGEPAGGSGFGVVFPDFPGCLSAGNTAQQAAEMAAEAPALHVEGMVEEGLAIPAPSGPLDMPAWLADAPGRSALANVTLDEELLSRLDSAAAATRSGFIAEAVRERLRRGREAA